jgi:N-acetylglucosamine-6-sulfatase
MLRPARNFRGARRVLSIVRRFRIAAGLVAVAAIVVVALWGGGPGREPEPAAAAPKKPNVIFVLTDDLSWDLVRAMPNVQKLQRRGMTFTRYTVTDSLCCPSRSSIFTGRFPHNTGVFTNTGADGGYQVFKARGWEAQTFGAALQPLGYRTGFMGKYLNGYLPRMGAVPGWTTWVGAGNAYGEFNYNLNEDGRIVHYAATPADYLTDVMAAKGSAFIDAAATAGQPFALEISTFAPHQPATPAPRDANLFPNAKAPRGGAFNRNNINPPKWLGRRSPLTAQQIATLDQLYRKRLQSIQAVDDLIGRLRATLKARGLLDDTYIVFSSDNGFHLGEHRLMQGKMTAFDTDIRLPLIVAGPGVPKNTTSTRLVQNVDLHPTFIALAGGKPGAGVDGRSIVPLLNGARVPWRTAALIEHHGPDTSGADPDRPVPGGANPTSYEAIRLQNAVYVEYVNGDREYYRIDRDPDERVNVYGRLGAKERAALSARVKALASCRGGASCWKAGDPRP